MKAAIPAKKNNLLQNYLIAAALFTLIVVGSLLWLVFYLLGSFATPSVLSTRVDFLGASCIGIIDFSAQLKSIEAKKIPYAPVALYLNGQKYDSYDLDQNGQLDLRIPLDKSICGKKISFELVYAGDNNFKPSNSAASLIVKAPTQIQISSPISTSNTIPIFISVSLLAINGDSNKTPIPNQKISLRGINQTTDKTGTAVFNVEFNRSGSFELEASFDGTETLEKSEAETTIDVTPLLCRDGTEIGKCSGSEICKPNQSLEFDCSLCGCSSGFLCFKNACLSPEQKFELIIESLEKNNVLIRSETGLGSGVIIGEENRKSLVLTNRHVIDSSFSSSPTFTKIEVQNHASKISYPDKIFLAPSKIDLAILLMDRNIGELATINLNYAPKRGASVVVIGSPLGLQKTVSQGIISNTYMANTDDGVPFDAIQIDAAVNPGNSGGGVYLAEDGTLIGITSFKAGISKSQSAEGIGFAIPVSLLKKYPLENWVEYKN